MAILYILLPFGIFYGYLVHFPHFGMFYQGKSGNPDHEQRLWVSEYIYFNGSVLEPVSEGSFLNGG
jgi:hypothetical protein